MNIIKKSLLTKIIYKLGYFKCNECNKYKRLSEYSPSKSNELAIQYKCKECRNEYTRHKRLEKAMRDEYYNRDIPILTYTPTKKKARINY